MKDTKAAAGFTVLEMAAAIAIIAALATIYFFLMDSYKERRMSEQAARVLMLAARVQEEFFAKEHRYFDAEVSGNGGDAFLTTPEGRKTDVKVPPNVVLSLKSRGTGKAAFTGQAFYLGGKVLHQYTSETGKMTTVSRAQDQAG
ncbi:MAG: prepilin-type N-terminal cleavage/methylation domain-containing protein [Desulfomonile tiedjei]|nr:prepilin-type N-terminal cleavage/methylation domain-containing protein [Desulfomonile tiedjei]